ncbi:MAG: hypothetical protein HY908_20880 [Myxococcales bacterium]|nr:hypothetical protein [Myxococcales bacterium]
MATRRSAAPLGRTLAWVAAVCLLVGPACGRRRPNATPEGAVRELVEILQRYEGSTKDGTELFALLSAQTKKNLSARADRYGAATGKQITPAAMLVPARIRLRFEPQSYKAEISGDTARVSVLGASSADRAELACVLEDEHWRVELPLPDLAPMRSRAAERR